MRVSSVGWLYDTIEKTREVARWTAEVTHNHPEGIRGAEATASVIFMARNGATKSEIKGYVIKEFGYDLSRTCDEIRPGYYHDESCQKTVPEAITAFLEGEGFEDVIRTAVSLGGDCDTLTCIAGGIAEAFYGVPAEMMEKTLERLGDDMIKVISDFDELRSGSSVDPFLEGNAIVTAAIDKFSSDLTNENLSEVIKAICMRIKAGGKFIFPVIAPGAFKNMIDPENVSVGDEFTTDEDMSFTFQHLEDKEGNIWAVAFTSRNEFQKGQSSDTLVMDIEQVLEGFAGDTTEAGIIINPWSESFLLRKDLITAILMLADKMLGAIVLCDDTFQVLIVEDDEDSEKPFDCTVQVLNVPVDILNDNSVNGEKGYLEFLNGVMDKTEFKWSPIGKLEAIHEADFNKYEDYFAVIKED